MPWVGRKKVAFIPVFRPRASPPDQIPPDWGNLILSRVVYDPDPLLGGPDGSLRAWLRAASSGLADIDPVIFTMRTIDRQDVLPDALEPEMGESLREQGFDHAAIVMLGGLGAGSNRRFWSRFVMVESTGIWAMEIIHGIAGFRDLYYQDHMTDPAERDIHRFDEMSHSGLSHRRPSRRRVWAGSTKPQSRATPVPRPITSCSGSGCRSRRSPVASLRFGSARTCPT